MLGRTWLPCCLLFAIVVLFTTRVTAKEPAPVLVTLELHRPLRDVFFPKPAAAEQRIAKQIANDCSRLIRVWPFLGVQSKVAPPNHPGLAFRVRPSRSLRGQYDFQVRMFEKPDLPIELSVGGTLQDVPFIKPGDLESWGGFPDQATLEHLVVTCCRHDVLAKFHNPLRAAVQKRATVANEFRWVLPLPTVDGDAAFGVLPLSWKVERCRDLGFAKFEILFKGNIWLVVEAVGDCGDFPPYPGMPKYKGLLIRTLFWRDGAGNHRLSVAQLKKLTGLKQLGVYLLDPRHALTAKLDEKDCTSHLSASEAP